LPNEDQPVCRDKGYVYKGTYDKYMLPIVYEGVYSFLKCDYFSGTGSMPYPISDNSYNNTIERIWDSADWIKGVFGMKEVARYNVNSLFF